MTFNNWYQVYQVLIQLICNNPDMLYLLLLLVSSRIEFIWWINILYKYFIQRVSLVEISESYTYGVKSTFLLFFSLFFLLDDVLFLFHICAFFFVCQSFPASLISVSISYRCFFLAFHQYYMNPHYISYSNWAVP